MGLSSLLLVRVTEAAASTLGLFLYARHHAGCGRDPAAASQHTVGLVHPIPETGIIPLEPPSELQTWTSSRGAVRPVLRRRVSFQPAVEAKEGRRELGPLLCSFLASPSGFWPVWS